MTFLGLDTSRDSGAPVEFFEFAQGVDVWRYTTADSELVCDGATYEPAIIKRDSNELNGEISGKRLTVTVTGYDQLVASYRNSVPPSPMVLTIKRLHRGDTEAVVVWSGLIRAVNFENADAKLLGEHVSMVAGRYGLFRYYQTMCSRIWGDTRCGVSSEDYAETTTISVIDSTVINCTTTEATSYYVGGYARVGDDYRMITASTASQITVAFQFNDISIGDTIKVYAGCDRTHSTCVSKFSNGINFGGCPYVPNENVFTVGLG